MTPAPRTTPSGRSAFAFTQNRRGNLTCDNASCSTKRGKRRTWTRVYRRGVVELLDRVLAYAYRIDQSGAIADAFWRRPPRNACANWSAAEFVEPLTLPDIARAVGASTFHRVRVPPCDRPAPCTPIAISCVCGRRSIVWSIRLRPRPARARGPGFRATATSRPASGRAFGVPPSRRAFWSAQYPDSRSFRRHAVIALCPDSLSPRCRSVRDHGQPALRIPSPGTDLTSPRRRANGGRRSAARQKPRTTTGRSRPIGSRWRSSPIRQPSSSTSGPRTPSTIRSTPPSDGSSGRKRPIAWTCRSSRRMTI